MFAVPLPRARRWLVLALTTAVVVPVLGLPQMARAEADDPVAGDTVVGEFTQVWQDFEDLDVAAARADEALLSFVRTEEGESVRVDTDDVGGLEIGTTVELTVGGTVPDAAALEDGYEPAREVLAAEVLTAAPATPGPTAPAGEFIDHAVTVVMVTPAGGVQDATTLQQVVDTVNGPVSDFWWSEAHERVRVVAGHDWMPTDADCSDPYALWDEVAAKVGFVKTLRTNLLLYVGAPESLGCAYGLGEVGLAPSAGGYAYVRAAETSVIAHELGHNMSLGHSSARACDGTVETGTCTTFEYADYYDVMGASWDQLGSLNVHHAAVLNGLTHQMREFYTGMPAETVTITPVSQQTGIRAVRLWGGPGKLYWLEYRPAAGRDAWLATEENSLGLQAGVLLRWAPGAGSDASLLLDGTPSRQSGWDEDLQATLPVGGTTQLAGGAFTVTVQSMTAAGATVRITGPQPLLPVGNWESLTAVGPTITVAGWALDPDTPATSIPVQVSVDGRAVPVTADRSRPDVGRAFPGAGDAHGFSWSGTAAPGTHQVCVSAPDAGQPRSTPLGCRSIGTQMALPVGSWDGLSASGSTLSLSGWAFDPDDRAASVPVHVYVDGRGMALTADRSRPDVGRAFPGVGDAHGFSGSVQVAKGVHTVCVYALDVDQLSRNSPLGCRSIGTQMALPVGSWDGLSASGSTLSLSGWAFDPDDRAASVPVHVYVDGRGMALTADRSRPDVGRAFPGVGDAHGFSGSVQVPRGVHTVCVYALDVDQLSRNTPLGCRSIATQMALPVGSWDGLSASGSTLSLSGWAFDPDDGAASVPVHVYVDGRGMALTADRSRPDVGRAFPGVGDGHGFSGSVQVAAGVHTVCVYALDVDQLSRNSPLGCRTIRAG